MLGDRTLFTDSAGIERLWELSTPLLEHPPRIHRTRRAPGGRGRAAADRAAPLVPARTTADVSEHVRTAVITAGVGLVVVVVVRLAMRAGFKGYMARDQRTAGRRRSWPASGHGS